MPNWNQNNFAWNEDNTRVMQIGKEKETLPINI